MKIPSSSIPQADKLDEVVRLVEAVGEGSGTYQDIAAQINKVGRQGRYYRNAAEIIGLVSNYRNHSKLTSLGSEFLQAPPLQRSDILLRAVLGAVIFQRVIAHLERFPSGISRNDLITFLQQVANIGAPSMAPRRISTIIGWLKSLGLMKESNEGLLSLSRLSFPTVSPIEYSDSEPLIPKTSNLKDYEEVSNRINSVGKSAWFLRDQAKLDRANSEHARLVNLIAIRIREIGAIPKSNQLIDLAALVNNNSYIFEMKSTNESNCRSQIRLGLSQLYEYRYLQAMQDANLVMVVSDRLPSTDKWVEDYLEKDRQVHLIWNGDNQLHATTKTQRELAFLW